MSTIKVHIQPLSDEAFQHPYHIRLPLKLWQQWNLRPREYRIKCGFQERAIDCLPSKSKEMVEISCTLANELHLPNETLALHLTFDHTTNHFEIGPIIAVLTTMKTDLDEPFGTLTSFYQEMARCCMKEHILFYLFSLKHVNNEFIYGYRWQHHKWGASQLPIPHAIYNRIHSRKLESSSSVQAFFQNCEEKEIPYFNNRFLNKWEVHQALLMYEELTPYLPESLLYEKIGDLENMMKKYNSIFAKPINGSLGKRILRIQKNNGCYSVDYSSNGHEFPNEFQSLHSLKNALSQIIKKRHFLLQQGIPLLHFRKRPVDFRILCNKNQLGEWKVTSGVARVSQEQKFVSNIAQGGEIYSINEVLSEKFNDQTVKSIKRLLLELALEISKRIDQEMTGSFGEFGIDLTIDESGQPWLLEVNSKPSKTTNDDQSMTIRPSAKAVINFAKFLSQFS
ncbi:YheC/YheD family protein [Bacillus taeanensis]|uniref:YheC/YheD family protein n=1 Tax=Bacillus taeanensis TaxID=273032 RepID=A0A366XX51_9BACI|nr:YheC/YheD family protein [Bacillus taeanensis]RBW69349.1 YheC/YheD family protein [Bacillus taeanensis]